MFDPVHGWVLWLLFCLLARPLPGQPVPFHQDTGLVTTGACCPKPPKSGEQNDDPLIVSLALQLLA